VLIGSRDQRILANGHDKLSTHGLLRDLDRTTVRTWIEQLVNQNYLSKAGEYEVLQLTDEGRRVLRGVVTPRLLKPPTKARKQSRAAAVSWEGVDRGLFDALRTIRRELAESHGVPPYVIFSDATLRELARVRPSTTAGLLAIHGIGQKKLAEYGEQIVREIVRYCEREGLQADVSVAPSVERERPRTRIDGPHSISAAKRLAFDLFARGDSLDAVQRAANRAPSTVLQYLIEFINQEGISECDSWLPPSEFEQIRAAAEKVGCDKLRPIFDELGGRVDYENIRIALACLRNDSTRQASPS
jgi:ATP-dependent DNA helicase RecQ